eukprot:SAG11_NODE_6252_length_1352_cov_1.470072_1_plen_86_part_00
MIIICGHYPLQDYAQFAAGIFMRTNPCRVFAATEATFIKDLAGELGGAIGDHAGRFETALLDVLCPGCTDLTRLPPVGARDLLRI